jgi:hypothetical protein
VSNSPITLADPYGDVGGWFVANELVGVGLMALGLVAAAASMPVAATVAIIGGGGLVVWGFISETKAPFEFAPPMWDNIYNKPDPFGTPRAGEWMKELNQKPCPENR